MATRASQADVEVIYKDIDPSYTDLTPFIEAANRLVTDKLGTNTTLSDLQKKDIEIWLSAHFIAMSSQRPMEEEIDTARYKYAGKTGMHLTASKFGQMVSMLDTTGTLSNLGKRQAKIESLAGDPWT